MTPFTWLLLGHLTGDWMLQNDWMARHKSRDPFRLPCLLHCLVYTAVMTATIYWLLPQEAARQWPLAATILFLSHWLIDGFQLAARWGAIAGQSNTYFVRIVVDQTFHLLVTAALLEWLL